jgi:hypothetical protein
MGDMSPDVSAIEPSKSLHLLTFGVNLPNFKGEHGVCVLVETIHQKRTVTE